MTGFLKALLAAIFILTAAIRANAQTSTLYSFRSRCNIEFSRNGATAMVIIDGKPCTGRIDTSIFSSNYFSVACGTRHAFSYQIDEGELVILNDKYQHGCESVKIILMDAPDDAALPVAFSKYLKDHDYVLEDTAAMLRKAKYMNGRSRFLYTAILLDAFIAKHPESADAHLLMADTYHGNGDAVNARKMYQRYLQILGAQDKNGQRPANREY